MSNFNARVQASNIPTPLLRRMTLLTRFIPLALGIIQTDWNSAFFQVLAAVAVVFFAGFGDVDGYGFFGCWFYFFLNGLRGRGWFWWCGCWLLNDLYFLFGCYFYIFAVTLCCNGPLKVGPEDLNALVAEPVKGINCGAAVGVA